MQDLNSLEDNIEAEKIAFSLLDIVTDGLIIELGSHIECPYLGNHFNICHLYNRVITKESASRCTARLNAMTKMYITTCLAHIEPTQIYDIIDENSRRSSE